MIGRPGTTVWLLAHEMRLGWRDVTGRRGMKRGWILGGVVMASLIFGGVSIALGLLHWQVPVNPLSVLIADAVVAAIFTLMLSQTLAAAAQALYARGDLDLLFSSPIAPRRVLMVRFAAIAFNVFAAFFLLIGPLLLPSVFLGHPQWAGVFVVLAALAFGASAMGLLLAMALFRLIGPRRTRTVAQVLAALIGAAFFLTSQLGNLLGHRTNGFVEVITRLSRDRTLLLPPGADWPLRAMLGEPAPLAILALAAAALFLGANQWLGARFAADAAAASGADVGGKVKAGPAAGFAGGAFATTFRKELRLLRRDAALLSQVFLRVLYLLPVSFIVLRNAHEHAAFVLPGGAAAIAFLAGQVAGSLTWITVSAEDAPELLACAPASIAVLMRAKLAAALTPLAVILVIPLSALIVVSPATGLAATAGAAACALASGLISVWYQKPAKRADFRRRQSGSWLSAIAQALVTTLIASAAALAAALSPWALLPAVLAAGGLLALRRTDAQIVQALRTA